MSRLFSVPCEDGFYMPGEFEEHAGCMMIWPVRPGSWPGEAKEAQVVFTEIARTIAESEHLWMLCEPEDFDVVQKVFINDSSISVLPIPTDDAWARDVGPTIVVKDVESAKKDQQDVAGMIETEVNSQKRFARGIDWQFNAWGGTVDGLYANWDKDNAVAEAFCNNLSMDFYNAQDFVLEGGSIHSDGEGTVIVTESCLLSKGRNPSLSKEEIEQKLKNYLGAKKIVWLPYGIYNDETNEHVDNVCAFVKPGEVVLAWTNDVNDPQYAMSKADLDFLESECDAIGRKFIVHKLLIPREPVSVSEEELQGFVFEEGEDNREVGERLAASYVNFYISNGHVIVPQFGDVNDSLAVETLSELFPTRKIAPIYARPIIVGGGNIHCITQQIPCGI